MATTNPQLYLAWLRNACTQTTISSIHDFQDGRKLLALAEDLTGLPSGTPETGTSKIHNINNCHRALRLFERSGVDTSSFAAEEFDAFNEKKIHSFIWHLIRRFSFDKQDEQSDFDTELLRWVQSKVHRRMSVPDLNPGTFRDGLALVALLEAYHPTQIDWENTTKMSTAERVHMAFDLMQALGFPSTQYAADDFLGPDTSKRDIATLLATMFNLLEMSSRGAPSPRKLARSRGTLERRKLKQRGSLPFGVTTQSPKDLAIQEMFQRHNLQDADTFTIADVAHCLVDAINTSPVSSPGPAQRAYDEELKRMMTSDDFQELLANQLGVSPHSAFTRQEVTHLLQECIDDTGETQLPSIVSACVGALQDATRSAQHAAASARQRALELEEEAKKQEVAFQQRLHDNDMAAQGINEEAEREITELQAELTQTRSKCKSLEEARSQLISEVAALKQDLAEGDDAKRAAADLRHENEALKREVASVRKSAETVETKKERLLEHLRSDGQRLRQQMRAQEATLQDVQHERDALAEEVARFKQLERENAKLRRQSRELTQQLRDSPLTSRKSLGALTDGTESGAEDSLSLEEELRQASMPPAVRRLPSAPSALGAKRRSGLSAAHDRLTKQKEELEAAFKEKAQDLYRTLQQLEAEKDLSKHFESLNAQLTDQLARAREDMQNIQESLDEERARRLSVEQALSQLQNQRDQQQQQQSQGREPQSSRKVDESADARPALVDDIMADIDRDDTMTDREKQTVESQRKQLEEQAARLEELSTAYDQARSSLESYVNTAQVEVAVHREVLEHVYSDETSGYQLQTVKHEKENHLWFRTPDHPQVLPSSLYPFQPEEDEQLVEAAQTSRDNWHHVAFAVPGRLDSELRERFVALQGHAAHERDAVLARHTPRKYSQPQHEAHAYRHQHPPQHHRGHRKGDHDDADGFYDAYVMGDGYGGDDEMWDSRPSTVSAYTDWSTLDAETPTSGLHDAMSGSDGTESSEDGAIFGDNFDPILQQHLGLI
ncbi:hypothetical protein PTSG_05246 [Salpingoeca rosetta]|uniref:Calponin-homology (CH) domain-containing protein n=1 Tax=Salpingoeca rosetta (strain ATCC 50818 / BSB-021) TaxID=946362 RepID=F2UAX4_SALR5|nr:uncharacterized protein PTSG_05246 [Salpingoeca rosetta]EGD73540.1 hypothetical protein PTSG_05246 [Salpingoeca rosetta]|eukprot:XP_004993822.1 hypothetical protein PTSG_05246 [Salpingoeca rosetta]